MLGFLRGSVGPDGGWKLMDIESPVLVDSAASALREIPLPDASATMFKQLATDVQASVGDGGSLAVWLAASLVRDAKRGFLEGIPLAKRQLLGQLPALATPHDWPLPLEELAALAHKGEVRLDDVDIRTDVDGWVDGIAIEPKWGASGTGQVLLVKNWMRTVDATATGNWVEAESARLQAQVQQVVDLGVTLLACSGALSEDVQWALRRAGLQVAQNVQKSTIRLLERATGATLLPTIQEANAASLGVADFNWDKPLLWVEGPGPGATFGVKAETNWAQSMVKDQAERQLRLAGALLDDDRALPADWISRAVKSLRSASPHAPGRAPIGMDAVADALQSFAEEVTRNQGRNPWDGLRLGPDALVSTRLAISAGLDTAVQLLRISERLDKRPSSGNALRGGGSKIGSPKGMPGDVPPLM